MKKSIDRLRQQALYLLREEEALKFAISPPARPSREQVKRNREWIIPRAKKRELLLYIENRRREISQVRREFGVTATRDELIEFLETAESMPPGQVLYPSIADLRGYFRDYEQVWPESKHLPAHTRLVWDLHGCGPDGEPLHGTRLVEAAIYEDMASLWNLIQERANAKHVNTTLREGKTLFALCRAALTAAVYFVEAYLNGLAFDHLANHEKDVTDDERSALFEWDFKKNGSRFLPLREKILRYQRIILKVQYAPVQPSNCAELETLIGIAERIRNPLAHPGPQISLRSGLPEKELAIFDITVETVREAVDVAIAVVRKLEEAIHGNLLGVRWLLSRTPEGTFPPEAFD